MRPGEKLTTKLSLRKEASSGTKTDNSFQEQSVSFVAEDFYHLYGQHVVRGVRGEDGDFKKIICGSSGTLILRFPDFEFFGF